MILLKVKTPTNIKLPAVTSMIFTRLCKDIYLITSMYAWWKVGGIKVNWNQHLWRKLYWNPYYLYIYFELLTCDLLSFHLHLFYIYLKWSYKIHTQNRTYNCIGDIIITNRHTGTAHNLENVSSNCTLTTYLDIMNSTCVKVKPWPGTSRLTPHMSLLCWIMKS